MTFRFGYFCGMKSLDTYKVALDEALKNYAQFEGPDNLYDPAKYILNLGGKRLRPILVLVGTELYGMDYSEALNAALAIEVFHNFTLVHDDIMDEAPIRRGMPTVHKKWDLNTGILSGDVMLIESYRLLEAYEADLFKPLINLFSRTATEVCEGQQMDMDFGVSFDISITDYLKMIELKTAVLVGCALKMGAIIAGADSKDQDALYDFGRYLGIAFQLQDDYLDAFGNDKKFGKQTGGDIIENKKTYLFLKAAELSTENQRQSLLRLYSSKNIDDQSKVKEVLELFKSTSADEATRTEIQNYTDKAFNTLKNLNLDEESKAYLKEFGMVLMNRTY